jgi:twitching motility protein PilT
MQLYSSKLISYEEAMRQSTNPDDFALKISGISSTSNSSWDQFTAEESQEEPQTESADGKTDIERF